MNNADRFTRAYLETLFWQSTADDGDEFDDLAELADEARNKIEAECLAFYTMNESTWNGQRIGTVRDYTEDEYAAHDFCLTRNHHGAGFWDGDWSEPAARVLTDAAHAFGETTLYRGGDGKLYVS